MMLYLRIDVKRVFGKVPYGRTGKFFASLESDAIWSGRFEETHTTCVAIDCCNASDAEEEFIRRDDELYQRYPNACVTIRMISEKEYDIFEDKEEKFDDFMHQILSR